MLFFIILSSKFKTTIIIFGIFWDKYLQTFQTFQQFQKNVTGLLGVYRHLPTEVMEWKI